MVRREKGFTLIELLVVIAIIAILAAMLFPVFARARESARKIQCLSNVKNIATAFQMYLVDYDRFNPGEHRQEVIDYFGCSCGCTLRFKAANPYLQEPVVLDEYVKNREVWTCPSARNEATFPIMNPFLNSKGTDDWFLRYVESQDSCPRFRTCNNPFPTGWGGAVTDTQTNRVWCSADGPGAFRMSIGVADNYDLKTSQVTDPAKWVVCGDGGMSWIINFSQTHSLAYPDVCRIRSQGCSDSCGHCGEIADEGCCTMPAEINCAPARGTWQVAVDPQYRKDHFPARHLGGSNVGFADGHAAWMSSEAILFDGQNASGYGNGPKMIENLDCCFIAEKLW
jgi:prepilin-type N-terminal cleavage/methylation domain-containing protein/prepilin-type processing-associated H-X9-DG protein